MKGKRQKTNKKTVRVPLSKALSLMMAPKNPSLPVQNASGAKSSSFGKGDSAAEKDFAKNATDVKQSKDVAIDKADDRKVIIYEWVEVIDSKYGNVIGFQPSKKVFNLLQNDKRFRENITQGNVLQLFYNGEWAKNNFVEVSCGSLEEYANLIRLNLDTVVPCDDALRCLQCSYQTNGRDFVANIPMARVKSSLDLLEKKLRKLIFRDGTKGIVDYFFKKRGG